MKAFITIKELKSLLEKKEISVDHVVSFYQDRIKKYNPQLNAILETFDIESIKKEFFGYYSSVG